MYQTGVEASVGSVLVVVVVVAGVAAVDGHKRRAGGHHVRGSGAPFVTQLLVLLPLVFGPSVLEPDLDLGFTEIQISGQLLAFAAHHISVAFEDLFQPEQLSGTEGGPDPLGLSVRAVRRLAAYVRTLARYQLVIYGRIRETNEISANLD